MDESLVANWNAVVRTDDLVWHLGDFGYRLKAERIRVARGAQRSKAFDRRQQ